MRELGGLPCLSTIMVQESWYWPCSVNPGAAWKLTGSSVVWTHNPFKLRNPCLTLLTWEFIFTSFWKLLLLYISLLSVIVNGTIPNYELRKRAVACRWLTGKKKKKASLPCYLSLISASCTELVVQWGVGHRKAFVLPFLCSNNSFMELDCDKSWHLHCPGLGIFTTHNIRSKSRSFSLYPVFSTQQSLLCSQYCNEWQTWPQSLCVCARLHRHDLIRVPNLLDCLETKANNKKILMFQVSDTKWYLKVYFPVTPSLLSPFLTSVGYSL